MTTNNDKIQFKEAGEKHASQHFSEICLGGVNISELARESLKGKLREVLSNKERVGLHQQYLNEELDEGIAEILIGDLLEGIEREHEAVGEAETLSTDGVFQNKQRMSSDEIRHPVLIDIDTLISVANTSLWPKVVGSPNLTITGVCTHESKRHTRDESEHAPDRSHQKWIHDESVAALEPFEDTSNTTFTAINSVPWPHGPDAEERSLEQELEQHLESYTFVILMGQRGRESINRVFEERDKYNVAVTPSYLLYLLHRNGNCSEQELCEAYEELLGGEGRTSYSAIQAIWQEILVDCSSCSDGNLLP